MKNLKIFFTTIFVMATILACQEEDPKLGKPLDQSQIQNYIENGDIKVVQDTDIDPGGNTVILINNVPSTIPLWDYGTGMSIKPLDTVRYAFKGDYTIKLSIDNGGGIVDVEPFHITVTDDNLTYVNDPFYNFLTGGGPGHSKTWVLDLKPDGTSTYFPGPLAFSSDNIGYGYECLADNESDCWNWQPNYQSWSMALGDWGTMTFDLIGGPFVSVEQKIAGVDGAGTFNGTYFMDVNTLTLSFSGVSPLNNSSTDNDFSKAAIIELSENGLALAFQSNSNPQYTVFNYVSKDYFDNYVPVEENKGPDEGFMPEFASGELLNILTGGKSSGRVWQLDAAGNPVDWIDAGNGWTTDASSSYNWGWNDDWTAAAGNSWIRFDQFGGTLNYTLSQGGVMTSSTFSINEETNEITLGGTNTLITDGGKGSWMNPSTNVITVIKGFPTEYETKGIWFGTTYDASKDEWFVFHYVLQ